MIYFVSEKKRRTRSPLSKQNVKVLEDWLSYNKNYPYPSPEDLEKLQYQTGLRKKQIRVWLTNYRNVS